MTSLVVMLGLLLLLAIVIVITASKQLSWQVRSAMVAGFILLSVGGYLFLGAGPAYVKWKQQAQSHYQRLQQLQKIIVDPKVIANIQRRLQQHPNDAKGWRYLGEVYLFKQQFPQAEQAFAQLLKLTPNNSHAILLHARAEYLANQGVLSNKTRQQLLKLSKKSNNHL